MVNAVVASTEGESLSNLETGLLSARRRAALGAIALPEALIEDQQERISRLPQAERLKLALEVLASGTLSQRQVSRLTGVSRDTLRKYAEGRSNDVQ